MRVHFMERNGSRTATGLFKTIESLPEDSLPEVWLERIDAW